VTRSSLVLLVGLILAACDLTTMPSASSASSVVPGPTSTLPPTIGDQLQHLAVRILHGGAPGVILEATIDGATLTATAGLADIGTGRVIANSNPFRIGSLTKTFTAALSLLLAEDGTLKLSDSVEDLLPGVVPNGSEISIQMLLNQTSGLFDYTDDPQVFGVYETDPSYVWEPGRLIQIATSHPPLFSPGDRWAYSNTNYIVLGRILEAVTEKPLDRLFTERLFAPFGLAETRLATNSELPTGAVHGYLLDPSGRLADASSIDPSEGWAAGGIVSTVADVTRFYAALLGGHILDSDHLEMMLRTVPADDPLIHAYGLGIYEHEVDCGVVWGHDGQIFGYQTFAFASRAADRMLVAVVNRPDNPWWLDPLANLVFCDESAAGQ
jgi:D-alanyl-D-alanine carboxypeptidase